MKKPTAKQLEARARFAEMARAGAFKKKRKTNPRKKTVSQKISQLVHEGYPQKQAVAVALSEQRDGKVKRNPGEKITWKKWSDYYTAKYKGIEGIVEKYNGEWSLFLPSVTKKYWPTSNGKLSGAKAWLEVVVDSEAWNHPKQNPAAAGEQHLFGNKYATIRQEGEGRYVAQVYEKIKTGAGEEIDLWGFKIYKTHAGAQRYLDSLKPVKNNPTEKRKVSAVVLMKNPKPLRKVEFKGHEDFAGYAIRRPNTTKWLAFFASKKDAVTTAQNVSDRTGEQLEVVRVQAVGVKAM